MANKEKKFVFGDHSFTCEKITIPIHVIWTWNTHSEDNGKVFVNQFYNILSFWFYVLAILKYSEQYGKYMWVTDEFARYDFFMVSQALRLIHMYEKTSVFE